MPEQATRFSCPYLNGTVELTPEREQHITENHPDLLPEHRDGLGETLLDPDEIRCSLQFSSALLFSKRYGGALDGKNIYSCRGHDRHKYERPPLDHHRIRRTKACWRQNFMEKKLTFKYDR